MSMDSCISALATAVGTELKGKQNVLVSGTNIKTVNGTSLLGSGDLTITGGGSTYTAGNGIDLTGDTIAVTADCDTKWSTGTAGSNAICVITERGNTGYGTCYRAANPSNYGDIGYNAVDLSYNGSTDAIRGATCHYSIAAGRSTVAEGITSTAFGEYTRAIGDCSTSIGFNTRAVGSTSVAMGYAGCATGDTSVVMGRYACAGGCLSIATGYCTRAYGDSSMSTGYCTSTYAGCSTVFGSGTQIGSASTKMFAVGYGTDAKATTTEDYNVHLSVDCNGLTCTKQLKIVDGTQGLGKVLTSDADGLSTWQTPSAGGGTQNLYIQAEEPTVAQGSSALWICKGTDGRITFNLVEGL